MRPARGHLTFEQHPVALGGSHPLTSLPAADRESLATNLQRYLLSTSPAGAALWQQLLAVAVKC